LHDAPQLQLEAPAGSSENQRNNAQLPGQACTEVNQKLKPGLDSRKSRSTRMLSSPPKKLLARQMFWYTGT
jgi:hypothetical protein